MTRIPITITPTLAAYRMVDATRMGRYLLDHGWKYDAVGSWDLCASYRRGDNQIRVPTLAAADYAERMREAVAEVADHITMGDAIMVLQEVAAGDCTVGPTLDLVTMEVRLT